MVYGVFKVESGDSLGPRPGTHLNPLVDVNDIAPFNLLQTYFFPRFVAKIVKDFPRSPTPIRWTGLAVPKPPIQFFFLPAITRIRKQLESTLGCPSGPDNLDNLNYIDSSLPSHSPKVRIKSHGLGCKALTRANGVFREAKKKTPDDIDNQTTPNKDIGPREPTRTLASSSTFTWQREMWYRREKIIPECRKRSWTIL